MQGQRGPPKKIETSQTGATLLLTAAQRMGRGGESQVGREMQSQVARGTQPGAVGAASVACPQTVKERSAVPLSRGRSGGGQGSPLEPPGNKGTRRANAAVVQRAGAALDGPGTKDATWATKANEMKGETETRHQIGGGAGRQGRQAGRRGGASSYKAVRARGARGERPLKTNPRQPGASGAAFGPQTPCTQRRTTGGARSVMLAGGTASQLARAPQELKLFG